MSDIEVNLTKAVPAFERYVRETLGVEVNVTSWAGADRLPLLLRNLYAFAEVRLFDTPCLLMVDTERAEHSPATLRKHIDMLQKKWDAPVIYVRERITAYNRKRLVEQKVPFIVPGNQMYVPMLGVDLREHFKQLRSQRPTFSPAAQALLIHALLRESSDVLNPGSLAERLGYSPMTMTRAFDELEAAKIGEISIGGRERRLRFAEGRRMIWKTAEPLLKSPVTKRRFVRQFTLRTTPLRAGLSALSQYSMLAPPAHTIVAVSREEWKLLQHKHKLVEMPVAETDAVEIEVWSYRPALLADGERVDPVSLYLSLKGSRDERVEAALDEMMSTLPW